MCYAIWDNSREKVSSKSYDFMYAKTHRATHTCMRARAHTHTEHIFCSANRYEIMKYWYSIDCEQLSSSTKSETSTHEKRVRSFRLSLLRFIRSVQGFHNSAHDNRDIFTIWTSLWLMVKRLPFAHNGGMWKTTQTCTLAHTHTHTFKDIMINEYRGLKIAVKD